MTCRQHHWRVVPSDDLTRETATRMAEFFSERPESAERKIAYTPEYFLWKINGNPAGPGFVSLAVDEDRIVGTLTLTRKRLWFRGRGIMAVEMADGLVDRDYRGRGIHAALVADARTRALADNVELLCGFIETDSVSLRVHEEKCFSLRKPNLDLYIYVLPLKPVRQLLGKSESMESLIRNNVFEGVRIPELNSHASHSTGHQEPCLRFDAFFDRLDEKLRRRYAFIFSRSAEDLRFRYGDSPEKEPFRMLVKRDSANEPEAVLIYKSIARDDLRVLFVADMYGANNDSVIDAWMGILEWGLMNDYDTVALWATNRWFEPFNEFPCPPVPIARREMVFFHNELGKELLNDGGVWHVSISDSNNI
ncbi:MAG: GNAT family N-acetyltransferase [Deltaproteobacteria bacterium]|nr:GNAT family N-acetyltransferase [Deltaproteobacteria bacterium]